MLLEANVSNPESDLKAAIADIGRITRQFRVDAGLSPFYVHPDDDDEVHPDYNDAERAAENAVLDRAADEADRERQR